MFHSALDLNPQLIIQQFIFIPQMKNINLKLYLVVILQLQIFVLHVFQNKTFHTKTDFHKISLPDFCAPRENKHYCERINFVLSIVN